MERMVEGCVMSWSQAGWNWMDVVSLNECLVWHGILRIVLSVDHRNT
jgi:hypothetical protein